MDLIGAILVVVLFVVLVYLLDIVGRAREAVSIARASTAIIRDPAIDDETKEASIQKHTLRLFYLLLLLAGGFAVALAVPIGVIWIAQLAGFMSLGGVLAMLVRWDFMLGATVFGVISYVVLARRAR